MGASTYGPCIFWYQALSKIQGFIESVSTVSPCEKRTSASLERKFRASGKGKGRESWTTRIKPLLSAAGSIVDFQETTYSGHAKEIANGLDLAAFDGKLRLCHI